MTHPRKQLDETIHAPIRYSIIAAVVSVDRVDFQFLRDALEITDSHLSKQLSILESAEYIEIERTFIGKRRRTYISATPQGRAAFVQHTEALQAIANGAAPTVGSATDVDSNR